MRTVSYWPEMGQKRPDNVDGDVRYGGPNHYMVKTPHVLKGRGIRFIETLTADSLSEHAQHKAGWHYYRVTESALEKLPYTFAREALLD